MTSWVYSMEDIAEFAEANRDMAIFGGGADAPAVAPAPPTEWTMELGRMAIFGGTGALRDPETEKEIYEHILKQQLAYMDGGAVDSDVDDDDTVDASAVVPMEEQEEEVGMLQILNFYTRSVVSEVELWLRDESYRHEHYDHDVGRRGKFLAFEGVRIADGSRFRVHIELSETVDETLRVIAACAYGGDVPGPAMEFVLEHVNARDGTDTRWVHGAGEKTWRQVLMMKPVAWSADPTNINIEMTMRNPHAVIVSGRV